MKEIVTPYKERLLKIKRRYSEVFGDLEAQVEHLKLLTLGLLLLLSFTFIGALRIARRPPVVIRVTEVGQAQIIQDLAMHNAPSEVEILHFAKTFTSRYTAYNAYTLHQDIAEAFNMMTPKFSKRARKALVESGELARVKEASLHVDIQFKEETVERRTSGHMAVSLVGVRTIRSYSNTEFKESNLFKSELVLKRVPRTKDMPYGLLVEEYRDMVLNRLEGGTA